MSTDLELCQELPKIKISAIKIETPDRVNVIQQKQQESSSSHEDQECRTPTSQEHKIPPVLCCPPAPRKPKRRPISCKRKLFSEQDFFEIVNRDEVDAFFQSSFDLVSISKRRCPCT